MADSSLVEAVMSGFVKKKTITRIPNMSRL